jgi:hypothetical protein
MNAFALSYLHVLMYNILMYLMYTEDPTRLFYIDIVYNGVKVFLTIIQNVYSCNFRRFGLA